MSEDVWTPRRTPRPAPRRQWEGEASSFDIPFTELTMFFVKASLAAALAMTLTSVVWVGLLAMFGGLGAGVYLAYDHAQQVTVPHERSSVAAVIAVPATPPQAEAAPVVAEVPPAPAPSPVVEAPRAPRVRSSAATSDSATDALIRAEIQQMRARKGRGY